MSMQSNKATVYLASRGGECHPVMVEISPGRYAHELPREELPRWAVAELVPCGGGDYRVIVHLKDQYITLNEALSIKLGLAPRFDTLKRLVRAGFIDGARIAPGRYVVSVESYYRHIDRIKADPEFWTPARIKKYREALW